MILLKSLLAISYEGGAPRLNIYNWPMMAVIYYCILCGMIDWSQDYYFWLCYFDGYWSSAHDCLHKLNRLGQSSTTATYPALKFIINICAHQPRTNLPSTGRVVATLLTSGYYGCFSCLGCAWKSRLELGTPLSMIFGSTNPVSLVRRSLVLFAFFLFGKLSTNWFD